MTLLVLIFYVHLVSISSIADARAQNNTNNLRYDARTNQRGAGADDDSHLFTTLSKLSSAGSIVASGVTALSDPLASVRRSKTQENKTTTPVPEVLWLNSEPGSNLVLEVSHPLAYYLKRRKRQAPRGKPSNPESELAELPNWPGKPYAVVRVSAEDAHILVVKRKVISMMLQSLYSAQERLWPMEPVIKKYEHLAPYRMAFIFMKLDQLVHEGHSILKYIERQRMNPAMTMTRRLQLHSHIMRRNVDVTYLVDYISERVPRDQVTRFRQFVIRKEQEDTLAKKHDWDKASTPPVERPLRYYTTT